MSLVKVFIKEQIDLYAKVSHKIKIKKEKKASFSKSSLIILTSIADQIH